MSTSVVFVKMSRSIARTSGSEHQETAPLKSSVRTRLAASRRLSASFSSSVCMKPLPWAAVLRTSRPRSLSEISPDDSFGT